MLFKSHSYMSELMYSRYDGLALTLIGAGIGANYWILIVIGLCFTALSFIHIKEN